MVSPNAPDNFFFTAGNCPQFLTAVGAI